MAEEKELTFEDRLEKVRETIDGLEGGQMSLEESVRRFESGMQSLKTLEKELEEIRRRVTILMAGPEGEREEPLEEET